MNVARDPYEVLGVKTEDSDERIRNAFLALVKKYHPDSNNGLGDLKAINEVVDAFRTIMTKRGKVSTQKEEVREVFRSRKLRRDQGLAERALNCRHCKGTMQCGCVSCSFVIVFKKSFFAGQCAACA